MIGLLKIIIPRLAGIIIYPISLKPSEKLSLRPFILSFAACLEIKGYKTVITATENTPNGRFATRHEKVRAVVFPAPRFKAKKLSTPLFIWTAPKLSIIGTIMPKISLTALFLKSILNLYFNPVPLSPGSCIITSRIDPIITPIAMLTIPIFFASSTTKIIEITFIIIGAIAGTVNLLWLFNMLVRRPEMLIITSENIIILFIAEKLEISRLLPDIFESSMPIGDEKINISAEITVKISINILVTELTKSLISLLSPFFKYKV